MLKHVVMWKFKKETPLGLLKTELEGLPKKVPVIRSLEVGLDVLKSDRSWDMVLTVTFDDLKALEVYSVHPDHKAVAELIGYWKENAVSVDYLD